MDRITLERSFNYDLIRSIVIHPRIYPHWAGDFHPKAEDYRPTESDHLHWMIAKLEDEILGVVIAYQFDSPIVWQVHHAILPTAYRHSKVICEALESWIWENTKARTIIGLTPVRNVLACRFALKCGMVEAGRIPNAYQKDGDLCDMVLFIKQRPS